MREYNMWKKLICGIILFLTIGFSPLYSQESKLLDFGHRVTIGNYNSYTNNMGVIEASYDFIWNFPTFKNYQLMDIGIGLSGLFVFDDKGNPRTPVMGLGVNGNMRIYTPAIRKSRLFLDGIMSLVLYSKNYPENGTKLNGGWHLGGGFEYSLEKNTKLFASIRWFHTSNNDVYGRDRNPSVNALGIAIGIQL